jgi:hypothetical protein
VHKHLVFIPSSIKRKSYFIEFAQFMLPSPDLMDTSTSCTTCEEALMRIEVERHHFCQEFKRDAVRLVMEKGVSVRKIGRDINIHPKQVHQWRRKFLAEGLERVHPTLHLVQ